MTEREEKIRQAVQAVKDGMPKLKASKLYGVPRATIQFRMSEKFKKLGYGPTTYLTKEEEQTLVDWINTCQRKGFPRRIEDVQHSVQNYIKSRNRTTPFPDGLPGKGWYQAFLKRHPELYLRTTESVTQASSCITEDNIRNWFKTIENELDREGLRHILNNSSRLFNGDETNFLLCPKNKKIIACKGAKNIYEVDQNTAKTSLTVMFTFCANGNLSPPMIIFPYKRKPPTEILETVPDQWGVGYSDNGWMKSSLFYEYIANVFNPYLERENIEKPVILFVDGHKSHLTLQISQLCNNIGIILIALYPNATRLLQPADVAAFKPLKSGWQKGILEWRREHPLLQFTKENFAPLRFKVIETHVKSSTVVKGFKATGLFPWNSNAIDYTKCIGGTNENIQSETEKEDNTNNCNQVAKTNRVLDFVTFKSLLGDELTKSLEAGNESINNVEKKCLVDIWKFFNDGEKANQGPVIYDIQGMAVDILETGAENTIQLTDKTLHENNNFDMELSEALNAYDKNLDALAPTAETRPRKDFNEKEALIVEISDNAEIEVLPISPLGTILHWPEGPKRKNKQNKEKLPYVITSENWKRIVETKENDKKIQEEEKDRKRKQREENKRRKEREVNTKNAKRTKKINILQDIRINPNMKKSPLTSSQVHEEANVSKYTTGDGSQNSAANVLKNLEIESNIEKNEGTSDKKRFMVKGICYLCGESISVKILGRKCSKCTRTIHSKCADETFFSEVFCCGQCK